MTVTTSSEQRLSCDKATSDMSNFGMECLSSTASAVKNVICSKYSAQHSAKVTVAVAAFAESCCVEHVVHTRSLI
jgi:hypothetical protein